MNINSSLIAKITKGKLTGPSDIVVTEITTDSRQVNYTEGQVFIALRGVNHDGHLFIDTLYNKGVKVFIVENLPEQVERYIGAAFIKTSDTVVALHLLASYKRKTFNSTVVAVTGSAGKSIVKEWIAYILGLNMPVIRSPKSYNSQIGVPLSVWRLDDKYRIGIFEAGISLPGEMDKLREIINPDIGVITNIGDAHSENFNNNEEKAREKLKLFDNSSVVVYCRDHELIHRIIANDEKLGSKTIVDWSFSDKGASVFVNKKVVTGGYSEISIIYNGKSENFKIPFSDRASVENAVTAATACLAIGVGFEILKKGLSGLVSVAMRMELRKGINNCQLIEDYYNSDPGSLGMAIDYMIALNSQSTTLILSDFIQSGRNEKELYGEVADIVSKTGIQKFIGIGEALTRNKELFDISSKFFNSTEEFISGFTREQFRNETILIKGARVFEFEKIGNVLEQQVHQTVLEIDLGAISHNINEFRRHLKPDTKIMAMVKAFAYGAGPLEISSLLEYHRVGYLAVAFADEGVALRKAGVTLPVMVMNPDPSSLELLVHYNLEPEIFSFDSLKQFVAVASRYGHVSYPVHIKIDTGMHRLGFLPDEIETLGSALKSIQCIRVVSVFSHLAASEDPGLDDFTHRQVSVFIDAAAKLEKDVGYKLIRHILNTAGIIRFPQYQFDMVRPGIGIYGIVQVKGFDLKCTVRFRTRISQVKKIKAGDPIGYGCTDISDHERDIAILPVGYADGLNRKLGKGRGDVFMRGNRVPIVGVICMDMCMADVTGLNTRIEEEVEIFGDNIKIEEVADLCQTIPYEILTSISGRVKRVFFSD